MRKLWPNFFMNYFIFANPNHIPSLDSRYVADAGLFVEFVRKLWHFFLFHGIFASFTRKLWHFCCRLPTLLHQTPGANCIFGKKDKKQVFLAEMLYVLPFHSKMPRLLSFFSKNFVSFTEMPHTHLCFSNFLLFLAEMLHALSFDSKMPRLFSFSAENYSFLAKMPHALPFFDAIAYWPNNIFALYIAQSYYYIL